MQGYSTLSQRLIIYWLKYDVHYSRLLQVIPTIIILHFSDGSEEVPRVMVALCQNLQRHRDAVLHALQQTAALTTQGGAKTLGAPNEQAHDDAGVLLHTFA
jgi:hypothetical protein